MREVSLNEGLRVLGTLAHLNYRPPGVFEGSPVQAVRFPSTLRELGPEAFAGFQRLGVLSLPEGLEVIGESCFARSGAEAVTIPASVREIGESAFQGCARLVRAEFAAGGPESGGLEEIAGHCFVDSGLARVAVSASVRRIGDYAFAWCRKLGEVSFAAGSRLERIGRSAFEGCVGLAAVAFAPGSRLARVGARAFAGVPAEIAFPAGAAVAPDALGGK